MILKAHRQTGNLTSAPLFTSHFASQDTRNGISFAARCWIIVHKSALSNVGVGSTHFHIFSHVPLGNVNAGLISLSYRQKCTWSPASKWQINNFTDKIEIMCVYIIIIWRLRLTPLTLEVCSISSRENCRSSRNRSTEGLEFPTVSCQLREPVYNLTWDFHWARSPVFFASFAVEPLGCSPCHRLAHNHSLRRTAKYCPIILYSSD